MRYYYLKYFYIQYFNLENSKVLPEKHFFPFICISYTQNFKITQKQILAQSFIYNAQKTRKDVLYIK